MKIKIKDHLSLKSFSLFKNNEKIEEMTIKKEPIDNAEANKKIPDNTLSDKNIIDDNKIFNETNSNNDDEVG